MLKRTSALLVFACSVVACSACFSTVDKGATRPRTVVDEYEAAVELIVTCIDSQRSGSGVMVGHGLVVTAAHVVDCPVEPLVIVTDRSGKTGLAVVVKAD